MRTVTLKGDPLELEGNEVKVGQKAPDFTAVARDGSKVSLKDTSGVRLFLSVLSFKTSVCDAELRRFNEEATSLGGATIYAISTDPPSDQDAWCGAAGVKNVVTLSDEPDRSFGRAYGVLLKGDGRLARAVFVVDSSNTVTYVEVLPE